MAKALVNGWGILEAALLFEAALISPFDDC